MKIYFPLLILAVAGSLPATISACKCYGDWTDEEEMTIKTEYSNNGLGEYEYRGIDKNEDSYLRCTCSDVTVVITNITLLNTTAGTIDELETNLTTRLKHLLDTDNTASHFRSFKVMKMPDSAETPSEWTIKFVVKGEDDTLDDKVTTMIQDETWVEEGEYYLKHVGFIDGDDITSTVPKCTDDPPEAKENAQRNWSNSKRLGTTAEYKCKDKYVLAQDAPDEVTCEFSTAKWSYSKDISCVQGCEGKPERPFFSLTNWTKSTNKDGDVVGLYCMNKYKSTTGKGTTSTCKNGKWTAIDESFSCEQILCPMKIPQTPAFGMCDWNDIDRNVGITITYTCMDGYSSTISWKVQSECLDSGKWSDLPRDFECVHNDYAKRMGFYDDQFKKTYDYYEDSEHTKEVYVEDNWFWIVTIPSIIAMAMVIVCCLCCTRTDSPLYVLCTGNTRNTSYIWK